MALISRLRCSGNGISGVSFFRPPRLRRKARLSGWFPCGNQPARNTSVAVSTSGTGGRLLTHGFSSFAGSTSTMVVLSLLVCITRNRMNAPFPGELGPRKRRDALMVSEPSEYVRAQRCQRACEKHARAVSHPPSQSAVQPSSERLCVSVSVSSVRWRGQAAEPLGCTAHNGGRKPGRAGTGNELPVGCEEGNGAVAPPIDGNVGIATIFSTSVSRPTKGGRRHLTKGRRCGRIRARRRNLMRSRQRERSKGKAGSSGTCPYFLADTESQNTKTSAGPL